MAVDATIEESLDLMEECAYTLFSPAIISVFFCSSCRDFLAANDPEKSDRPHVPA